MATRVRKIPQPFVLAGRIRSCDISYHIAQSQERQFSEVLALEILAEIESIPPKFKRHLGKDLQVSFTGSGRVSRDDLRDGDDNAIYLIDLRAESRYLSGVIPSDIILALPGLLDAGRIAHLVVDFEEPRQGRGWVRSIDFVSEGRLADYLPQPSS
jgi:hypothetical protein